MMDLFEVYKKLKKIYGQQGWWPIKINRNKLGLNNTKLRQEFGLTYGLSFEELSQFKTKYRDPYFEIAVGSILTQNTSWKNVAVVINNLHKARVLRPEVLVKLNKTQLQQLIRPTGYYRQKTKKLRLFSNWLLNKFNKNIIELKNVDTAESRNLLLDIWGIGPETADSILLYALNKPIFVIDLYTKRLLRKIAGIETSKPYGYYQDILKLSLPKSTKIYREFHALIVASGKDSHKYI